MTPMEQMIQHVQSLEACRSALQRELEVIDIELARCQERLNEERVRNETVQKAYDVNAFLHDKKTRRLAEYFKSKGLLITSIQPLSPLIQKRYRLAKTIHTAKTVLVPFLRFLYDRKSESYDFSQLKDTEKVSLRNFLTQLKVLEWLDFDWSTTSNTVTVKRKIPKDQYVFFNGGWAEEATRYQIERILHDLGVPSRATYREVKVEGLPGTKSVHEFDFIVEFKDRVYIFETKTGSLGVERWIEHARMFNDVQGPNRFLMCTALNDLPSKIFQPYRLFHLDTLAEEFADYVRREFLSMPPPVQMKGVPVTLAEMDYAQKAGRK